MFQDCPADFATTGFDQNSFEQDGFAAGDYVFSAAQNASSRAAPAVGAQSVIEDFDIPAPQGWRGELGAALPADTVLRLRSVGPHGAAAVAVMGGISAGRVVDDESNGWWTDIVGATRAVNTKTYRVISMDFVGGDGVTPLELTPADQADLFAFALDHIGVERLHAFIGASFGGMVGLAFARKYKARLSRLAVLCAAHRPSPLAQGWRTVQRQILEFAIANGKPEEGVAIARGLAMTSYRSSDEFNARFSCEDQADGGVRDYLSARGAAYREQMPAARYLTLSAAIDRHFETPEDIDTPTLIIGADSDQVAPWSDLSELDARLSGPSEAVRISSLYGHDSFLKEPAIFGPLLAKFLVKE